MTEITPSGVDKDIYMVSHHNGVKENVTISLFAPGRTIPQMEEALAKFNWRKLAPDGNCYCFLDRALVFQGNKIVVQKV